MNSATLTQLNTRLTNNLSGTQIRWLIQSDPNELTSYDAGNYVYIVIGDESLDTQLGSGRWGVKATRNIVCHVVTYALEDEPGNMFATVQRHLDIENTVTNALLLYGDSSRNPVGFLIYQTNSDSPHRIETDVGRAHSRLNFECRYTKTITNTP